MTLKKQRILVFQQNNSGEAKIAGIRQRGRDCFELEILSINTPPSPVLDDTGSYLPREIDADLVLDFLKHPDLSYDLAVMCREKNIPVVASGKKLEVEGTLTPPT
jgi:hypothetical protein